MGLCSDERTVTLPPVLAHLKVPWSYGVPQPPPRGPSLRLGLTAVAPTLTPQVTHGCRGFQTAHLHRSWAPLSHLFEANSPSLLRLSPHSLCVGTHTHTGTHARTLRHTPSSSSPLRSFPWLVVALCPASELESASSYPCELCMRSSCFLSIFPAHSHDRLSLQMLASDQTVPMTSWLASLPRFSLPTALPPSCKRK